MVISCSKKSEIEPLSPSRSVIQNLETQKINIKYPLISEDLGYYDDVDVIGKSTNPISGVFNVFKGALFNFAASDLKRGKLKINTSLLLPRELYPHIKSLKIKRAFFVLDSCVHISGCERKFGRKANLNWLGSMHAGMSHDMEVKPEDDGIVQLMFLGISGDFRKFRKLVDDLFERNYVERSKKDFTHLARFRPKKSKVSYIRNHFLIKSDEIQIREIIGYLKFHKKKLNIKELSSFGPTLLIETSDDGKEMFKQLRNEQEFVQVLSTRGQLFAPIRCDTTFCAQIDVNSDTEMMPFLRDERDLNVHLYIDVNKVPKFDFTYTGFIELEGQISVDPIE